VRICTRTDSESAGHSLEDAVQTLHRLLSEGPAEVKIRAAKAIPCLLLAQPPPLAKDQGRFEIDDARLPPMEPHAPTQVSRQRHAGHQIVTEPLTAKA
jgi:hypothetical protein